MSIATMKNIFKMMLVAVAAIGIASCSTEQEQFVVDSVGATTVFEISMSFDETRSQFNGLNDAGTAYTSVFGGYEKFNYSMVSTDRVYSDQGNIEPNAELTGSLIRPTITIRTSSSCPGICWTRYSISLSSIRHLRASPSRWESLRVVRLPLRSSAAVRNVTTGFLPAECKFSVNQMQVW